MPVLALWRLTCTAIGLAIEFVVALVRALVCNRTIHLERLMRCSGIQMV